MGTLDGKILFYDIRWKGSILSIDLHSQSSVSCVSFQPPQWAIETFKESMPTISNELRMIPRETKSNEKCESNNIMGIFSPVNKSKFNY